MFKYNLYFCFIFLFSCSSVIDIENNIEKNNSNVIPENNLEEKVAQMIMIRANGKFLNNDHWMNGYIKQLITKYKIGGLITFGGSVHGTFHNLKYYQSISDIPLFIAADYERGLGTFIDGTLFPPNMAVAATGNPDNSYKQAKIIAQEAKAIGVNMILAPVIDINNNYKNPIINIRSYGDNKDNIVKYSIPFIKGIEESGLISCVKHYPGHGNTATDSHTRLPIIDISKEELYSNELYPFREACKNDVSSVMVGHIMIPEIDSELPATFSKKITQDILRNKWDYNGLIITDALEMGALTSKTWHGESAIKAIEAGADIILLPIDGVNAINSILEAIKEGRLSEERINNSYERIMYYKEKIDLENRINNNWDDVKKYIGSKENKKIASDIAQKSITLVKNDKNIVPLIPYKYKKITHLLLSTDNDLRTRMKTFVRDVDYIHGNVQTLYVNDPISELGKKDILAKVNNSDMIIVSMLIRISMDKGMSTIHFSHADLLKELDELNIPIIGLSFGSPYLPEYTSLDAYLCTYGYGSVSFNAATNALFGRKDIEGKLPINLDSKYKRDHGYFLKRNFKVFDSEVDYNLSSPIKVIEKAIENKLFPGAQIFVSKGDNVIFNDGLGSLTYDKNAKNVDVNTVYDVASLTKVLATTPIIMKLVQKNNLGLDFPISEFYDEFLEGNKKEVTIRHLLTHTSGLKAYVEYYKKEGFDSNENVLNHILNLDLEYSPGTKVVYSDLGMILLFDIIEKVSNSSFEKLASRYFYTPLMMSNTYFNPPSNIKGRIAPTEYDDYFRNRLLHGEVHDENAYLLGGFSGHAGLFSTARDIANFSKLFINDGVFLGRRYFKKNIINKFTTKEKYPIGTERTIGWDTPSINGKSSAGDYFSENSYGHLGFTGTSLWIDPDKDIIVVLLTNRVHPSRDNTKEMYVFRREFHNSLMDILKD